MRELVEELRALADASEALAAELPPQRFYYAVQAAHHRRRALALRAAADRLEAVERVAEDLERDADVGFAAGDEFPA